MTITNAQSGTNVAEIADGIYRINTPIMLPGGAGFSFNQYLVLDDEPLLFHMGLRRLFPLVSQAVETIIPLSKLRYIVLSHVEADECGSLNEWLAAAPHSRAVCSKVAAIVSIADLADRPPLPMADGQTLSLGRHTLRWLDAPHLPHSWDCGYFFERETKTLFCGDLFTQGGADLPPITESDILEPSESFRRGMDYYSHTKYAKELLTKLAQTRPITLACMHGSAWRGNGGGLLMELAEALTKA